MLERQRRERAERARVLEMEKAWVLEGIPESSVKGSFKGSLLRAPF